VACSCRFIQTWGCLVSRPALTALIGGRPARARTQAASRLRGPQTPSCAHWATIVLEA
jgi:hypothetical protein